MQTESIEIFVILPQSTIIDALQKIDKNSKGILFVIDKKFRLIGSLTDGDIRRWLIKTGDLYGTIEFVMNKNPKTITSKDINKADKMMEKFSLTAILGSEAMESALSPRILLNTQIKHK